MTMLNEGYSIEQGALMLLPGTTPELVEMESFAELGRWLARPQRPLNFSGDGANCAAVGARPRRGAPLSRYCFAH